MASRWTHFCRTKKTVSHTHTYTYSACLSLSVSQSLHISPLNLQLTLSSLSFLFIWHRCCLNVCSSTYFLRIPFFLWTCCLHSHQIAIFFSSAVTPDYVSNTNLNDTSSVLLISIRLDVNALLKWLFIVENGKLFLIFGLRWNGCFGTLLFFRQSSSSSGQDWLTTWPIDTSWTETRRDVSVRRLVRISITGFVFISFHESFILLQAHCTITLKKNFEKETLV